MQTSLKKYSWDMKLQAAKQQERFFFFTNVKHDCGCKYNRSPAECSSFVTQFDNNLLGKKHQWDLIKA